ncbi:MAG TPA: glycosyltransferase family 4 protein, partial [Vicinamibacterales bacterium]
IHIVPNSAEDRMFVPEPEILDKFANARPLKVLYLSAMTPQKGYLDLIEAWLGLDRDVQQRIQLDFAGKFDVEADRASFLRRIDGVAGVRYHGLVDPEHKRCLFAQAHIFCLPTRLFEGQPISILEAYGSGCVVLTTGQRGILDVFRDGVNGFVVPERSAASIGTVLSRVVDDIERLRQMAVANRRTAEARYRPQMFTAALTRILEAGSPA